MVLFGVVVAIFTGIMIGSIASQSITFPTAPTDCGLLCVNYLVYGVSLIVTVAQLFGNTVIAFTSGTLVPFPFNMILLAIIGIPTALLLYLLAVQLIP